MTKEMRELYNAIKAKKEEAKALVLENKIEEAKELKNEIASMTEKYDLMNELHEEEKREVEVKMENKIENKIEKSYEEKFLNSLKTKFQNGMSEGVAEDGGYTVPQDIQTKINELREAKDSLQSLIKVEKVNTLSGSRVFKKRANTTGFAKVTEGGTIAEQEAPKFSTLEYKVDKYAGFFKMTNELLADTQENVKNTLIDWIGNESRITRNKLILEALDTKEKTAMAGLDDIKKAINVTLDPAFLPNAVVVTNQEGFNYLDTLVDGNGNYILQADITNASVRRLFGKYPVHVISTKDLPMAGDKAPIIIGDLKEACVMFDRQTLSIMASNTAGDAFLSDVTLFRAIEREQVKMRDEEAIVYGQITIVSTLSSRKK